MPSCMRKGIVAHSPSLKEQNAWLLRAVLLLHAVVFAYVAFEPVMLAQLHRPDLVQKLQEALAPGTLSLAVIALTRIVLLGLIPARLRDRAIHWRWRNPLPGSRAFTNLGPADPRVDMSRIENRYGPLPDDPGRQGALFYRIYSAHAKCPGVLDAHRSYLAARDIGMINLLMFLLLPTFAYWATGELGRPTVYAGILLLSYTLMSWAAQIYGERLVENSLAAASAEENTFSGGRV